jgi:DNA-binding XRE family transcriptional regulator
MLALRKDKNKLKNPVNKRDFSILIERHKVLYVNSEKSRTFAENCQDIKITGRMTFTGRIRQLREERQLPQRKVAEALDIDSATYCKIERGERRARKEHLSTLADLLQADREELLILWLADQVAEVVAKEKELSDKVLSIAKKNIK